MTDDKRYTTCCSVTKPCEKHRNAQHQEVPPRRVLITHPHDGHGATDTCFDCIAANPEGAQS